jgi:hypothetical protein
VKLVRHIVNSAAQLAFLVLSLYRMRQHLGVNYFQYSRFYFSMTIGHLRGIKKPVKLDMVEIDGTKLRPAKRPFYFPREWHAGVRPT